MDGFDDLDEPTQIPSRTAKFAPKGAKFKQKPKTEPAKSELQNLEISTQNKEEQQEVVEDIKPQIKNEQSVSNDSSVKMEIDSVKPESKVNDSMGEDNHENEDDDGDMIVREIDVHFTPCVDSNTQLYVMQYPLRPCWRPYELDQRCEEVRVKPNSTQVEIDLSIDDSTNWDHAQAAKFNIKNQTLSSSFMPPRVTGYAVGVLVGNKLFLNPIHAVVQLRPSLEHLKSTDSKRTNIAKIKPEVKLGDADDGKSTGPSKKQIKRAELPDNQTFDADECWIPLKYLGSKSEFSYRYLQKMMAQESSPMEFSMTPYDYMSSLCPITSSDKIKLKVPSRRLLLSVPLEERVKKLLLEGPPVQRFSVLKHFAPDDTVEDLLKVLQQHGLLVQGLWAPKTSLLIQDSNSKQGARDYVLCLLSKNLVIHSSQLNFPPKIKEDIRVFLEMYAVERPSFKDWKFKEHTDVAFLKHYPDIARKQEEAWENIEKRLSMFFDRAGKAMKKGIPKPHSVQNPVKHMVSERSAPKTTAGNKASAKRTITVETREALLKVLPKVFQNHKVCSFQLICQGLQDLAVAQSTLPKADPRIAVAAASAADAPPEELHEIISQVATNIHGSYVLKSSPEHPQYDQLRKVVIDLLLARGPSAKLKKAEVCEAARLAFKRDVTNIEYNKVMTEFCESKGSAWVLKSGDGKPS